MLNDSLRMQLQLRPGLLCGLCLTLTLAGCATTGGDDPLRNTKRLAAEGHASLYRNGAFQVPNTTVKLIPAGPDAGALALELAGLRARESFQEAIRKASESVQVVASGSKTSYRLAGQMHEGTDRIADAITAASRGGGVVLIDRSLAGGKEIIGSSWDTARDLVRERSAIGGAVIASTGATGDAIAQGGSAAGKSLSAGSIDTARGISQGAANRAADGFPKVGQRFVRGYAALPAALDRRTQRLGDRLTQLDPRIAAQAPENWRATWSKKSADLFADTVRNYTSRVGATLDKAGQEFRDEKTAGGVSLAAIRSLRWVLQAAFWDATIEPLGNMTVASVGYVGVNLVAYPTLVVAREGVAVTELAVEVVRDVAGTGWDLIAPTGTAAVASVFHAIDYVGSQAVAGVTATGGVVAGQTLRAGSQVTGVAIKAGGQVAGRGVEYIGVPLAAAGVAVGGGTVGTVVGGAGAASGGVVVVGGEVAGVGTQVVGNVLAGTTLVGGTTASVVGGTTYGVYQLSKAVVVPAGYELGSGLVVSYSTATQLGAQAVLAVSDCAYLVLSLEGPRWVIYAVRGKVSDGSDVAPGTVLDLKAMQNAGEEILYLPVGDAEMLRAVDSVYDSLPVAPAVVKAPAAAQAPAATQVPAASEVAKP